MVKLTVFEEEVLSLKNSGMTDKSVARLLNCNERRVSQAFNTARMKNEVTARMQILESGRSIAWCLDRRGNAIQVNVHPFGALDDDAIEDALWLFCVNSMFDNADLIDYISAQICLDYGIDETWKIDNIRNLVDEVLFTIESTKGMARMKEASEAVKQRVLNIQHTGIDSLDYDLVEKQGMRIKSYLNENYLRVRLGSLYQTYTERAGALYFRTSSTDGFNWYNIIIRFISDIVDRYKVQEVTIERDMSATGDSKIYVDHMSLNDFLMQKPQVIESVKRCGTILKEAK